MMGMMIANRGLSCWKRLSEWLRGTWNETVFMRRCDTREV